MEQLQINLLGEFSLTAGDHRISARDNRSKKVWLLLAYLICRKNRIVSQSELIEQLWGEEPTSDNPENALKVTLHRARGMLDKLWSGAGHTLILRKSSGYCWNTEIPMEVDSERFELLCTRKEAVPADALLEALALYRGEFLGNLSSGAWVIPVATHYHNLYINTVLSVIPELTEAGRYATVVEICRKAVAMEPYHEELHCHLMSALLSQGDQAGATAVYDALRTRLFHDFGITPGQAARELYRQANRQMQDKTVPIETVLEHLLEQDPAEGALLCDFDCFRVLCHVEARAMLRSGNATHVALLSVSGEWDKTLTKRSLDRAMENLGQQIRTSLRRGDAFAKCSPAQYVIMLPRANYENSCVVCRRVISAFYRRYPHSSTRIHYMVRPLVPKGMEAQRALVEE